MLTMYLGLPLWYWLIIGFAVISCAVLEILEEFLRYDVFVDDEFYRECNYHLYFLSDRVKIWNSDTGLFQILRFNAFARVNCYWKWKKPPEEYYEKLEVELQDVE